MNGSLQFIGILAIIILTVHSILGPITAHERISSLGNKVRKLEENKNNGHR